MGYAHNSSKIKVENETIEAAKESNLPLDQSFIQLEEYPVADSFFDSLLNFDDWFEDNSNLSLFEVMNSQEKPNLDKRRNPMELKKENEEEVCSSEKLGDLDCSIQEGMGRVCLTSGAEVIQVTDGGENITRNDVKQESQILEVVKNDTVKSEANGDVKDGGDLDDSEKESSSSSSSSSDDDEDDDDDDDSSDEDDEKDTKKEKSEIEMEEGEIREAMVAWSDDEDVDVVKGPIRSKNEVQDLPPVPPVNVTIQPHHQTLPVGIVLSIMGTQVIVEGVENHNPLSEGSILWITESRSPLGIVDEIFGPIKNPYYIVRYNSETEIPNGIQQGSLISFVPEFADYVLNNNNLYKKGYDASGENDEELSEELEFSDDEKEAEYKKMLKMSKRGSSEHRNRNTEKDKKSRNRVNNRKNIDQPLVNSHINSSSGPATGPQVCSPSQQAGQRAPNFAGVWPNGFPSIQPPNFGFPPNQLPFMNPNFIQPPVQNLGMPNLSPFHPQVNATGPLFPPNFGVNPTFVSWPISMPSNNFNQTQLGPPLGFPQGVAMPNGLQMENHFAVRRPFAVGNAETSEYVNQGKEFQHRGGRKPFQRGGRGRFRGGRNGP